jgi:hypothetical protein
MSNKAQTRFPALEIGQRFVWRGERYVKTSPLLACSEVGGRSQMIPRSAVVELANAAGAAAPEVGQSLRQALDELRQTSLKQIDALVEGVTAPKAARARKEIETAYRRTVKLLDETSGE